MLIGAATTIIIGIICIILGISNMRGNISSLHSYHRHRVSEQDRLPFGRLVGLGTIIIGISIVIMSVFMLLTFFLEKEIYTVIGTSIMAVGLISGMILSFYAMKKYNGGIF